MGYLQQKFNINIVSDEEFANSLYKLVDLSLPLSTKNKIIYLFEKARMLSHKVSLKTLDLLHLAYAEELSQRNAIRYIITFDKGFIKNASVVKKETGIEIISKT
mgnify:CR=1 FL=1